jgi:hypothetical protein
MGVNFMYHVRMESNHRVPHTGTTGREKAKPHREGTAAGDDGLLLSTLFHLHEYEHDA